jgi:hypothetical protein
MQYHRSAFGGSRHRARSLLFSWISLLVAGAGMIGGIEAAHGQTSNLCIVPVLSGKPGEAGLQDEFEELGPRTFVNSPLFFSYIRPSINHRNAVSLDKDNHLLWIPSRGFPSNLSRDEFAVDPTGRVAGVGYGQIYTDSPGEPLFTPIAQNTVPLRPHAPAWVTAFRAIGWATDKGVMLLNGDELAPLTGIDWKVTGPISSISDLPEFDAAALATRDGRLFVLDAARNLHQVPALDVSGIRPGGYWRRDIIGGVTAMRHPDQLLVTDLSYPARAFIVPMRRDGALFVPGRARPLPRMALPGPYNSIWTYYPEINRVLAYGTPSGRFSLSPDGLYGLQGNSAVAIAGGRAGDLGKVAFIWGVPSRREIAITSSYGVYLYNGHGGLRAAAGWSRTTIGSVSQAFDLPALGLVVVGGEHGLFKLTERDRLIELPMPGALAGTNIDRVIEMPASRVAIIFTRRGVAALDANGRVAAIPGAWRLTSGAGAGWDAEYIPVRNEVLFSAWNGHFLVRDEAISGPGSCAGAKREVPPAKVSLLPVDSPELAAAGPITGVVESLHRDRAVAATPSGGFAIDGQGRATPYRPFGDARIYQRLPWGAFLLQTPDGAYELLDADGTKRRVTTEWRRRTYLANFHFIGFASRARMAIFDGDVLGPDAKIAPIPGVKFGDRRTIESVAEVPWLDRPLVFSWGKICVLEPDRSLVPLPTGPKAAMPMRNWPARIFGFWPIPQLKEVLVGDADIQGGGWGVIGPHGDYRAIPALDGQEPLFMRLKKPALGRVLLSFMTDHDARSQWLLAADGEVQRLPRRLGTVAAIAALPSKQLLIGTNTGLYVMDQNGTMTPVPDGGADQVGAVRKMPAVPWLGEVLIEATNGDFLYSVDAGLRSIPGLEWSGPLADLHILPHLHEIWAVGQGTPESNGSDKFGRYRGQLRRVDLAAKHGG